MRSLCRLCSALVILSPAIFSQSTTPRFTGGFGNVVFPGGTSAVPGTTRFWGNVAYPGTGGPKLQVPFSITDPTFAAKLGANVAGYNVYGAGHGAGHGGGYRRGTTVLPYAYPVYVGSPYMSGYVGDGYADPAYAPVPAMPQQQQPNITVIYPPAQQPVVINQFGQGAAPSQQPDTVSVYQAPVTSGNNPEGQSSGDVPTGYLIALKDHSIYSAVAYWVEGDTLHYFTSGNNHNQASLSLVDRELTERLNREKGTEVRLPK